MRQRQPLAEMNTDVQHLTEQLENVVEALDVTRQPACRECLDWSMRRSHLGGRAGRGFLAAIEARGWACRVAGSRVIRFTPEGARRFDQSFPVPRGDESLDLARTRT